MFPGRVAVADEAVEGEGRESAAPGIDSRGVATGASLAEPLALPLGLFGVKDPPWIIPGMSIGRNPRCGKERRLSIAGSLEEAHLPVPAQNQLRFLSRPSQGRRPRERHPWRRIPLRLADRQMVAIGRPARPDIGTVAKEALVARQVLGDPSAGVVTPPFRWVELGNMTRGEAEQDECQQYRPPAAPTLQHAPSHTRRFLALRPSRGKPSSASPLRPSEALCALPPHRCHKSSPR